tara:strand:+ start:3538 stop:4017 length:480 start_codon:yes stop_codon:yes gene_type:complete
MKLFKKLFTKKEPKKEPKKSKTFDDYSFLLDLKKEKVKYIKIVDEYEKDGHLFKLGDKVLTKSNECDTYMVGKILSFYNNSGKWSNPVPYVESDKGYVMGVMGIMKPYTEELENNIKNLKPLEQWNYFVGDDWKYSEEEMVKKQSKYDSLQKIKENFVN